MSSSSPPVRKGRYPAACERGSRGAWWCEPRRTTFGRSEARDRMREALTEFWRYGAASWTVQARCGL